MRACNRSLARFFVHVLAVRELLFDDVDLRDVLEAARPLARLETDDAAHDLGGALKHHQYSSHRNHRLELVDRRALRRHGRMLPDGPRFRREHVSRVNERRDSGDEEDDVEHQVETSLHPRPHRTVEKIAADVGILRERVGAGQHEQRAVEHVIEVEDPRRRRIQDVALEDLDTDDAHQRDDQPRRSLADPSADTVNRVQDALDVHPLPPLSARKIDNNKAPSGRAAEWCFASSARRQIGFLAFGPHYASNAIFRLTTVSCSHCVARLANASWDSMISLNSGFSAAFFLATSSKTSSCRLSTESGVL